MTDAALSAHSNRRPALLLLVIQLVGLYCMFGVAYQNGYIQSLIGILTSKDPLLPGSRNPVLLQFFRIPPLDHLLSLAQVMYANFFDGSSPKSSLYALQFGGQLVPLSVIIWIESARTGNQKTKMFLAIPWLLTFLAIGYGAVMGIYTGLHLLYSPTATTCDVRQIAERVRARDSIICEVLPLSIILGQIVPTFFMALPFFSIVTHQWLNALWQAYPIWTFLVLGILGYYWKQSGVSTSVYWASGHSHASEKRLLHKSYLFAFITSFIVQITTYISFFLRKALPGLGLKYATLADVFKPEAPWYPVPAMRNAATGARTLFQYDQYFGSTAAVVWAVTLLYNAHGRSLSKRKWGWLAGEICLISFLAGPAAAAVTILWHRDEYVMNEDEHAVRENSQQKFKAS